ncbi:MAG: hypothetical protein BI182_05820 [Acetobacterium sp. MES1]|nr:MAG: hypothetical protein BI182_05820 [Acetobacterium sp. MES1]
MPTEQLFYYYFIKKPKHRRKTHLAIFFKLNLQNLWYTHALYGIIDKSARWLNEKNHRGMKK